MISKNEVAAVAAFAAALMMSSAAFACEGVSTQASDCILYYGPVGQSPYKGTVPNPGQRSTPQANHSPARAASASR
jgi:hypothetical protein